VDTPYKLIKDYSVTYYAGGKNVTKHPYRAVINLYEQKKSGYLGSAYFHRTVKTVPDTDTETAKGVVYMHFTEEQFAVVLDLLRNEQPLYLHFTGDKWHIASFNTAREPVGEGELK
jgi:hypothetical protein